METQKILVFRTNVQAILWQKEIEGQLSDGQWENTKPNDHWEYWTWVRVLSLEKSVTHHKHIGRSFHVRKDDYALGSKDLLDCIGGRMVAYARLALAGYDLGAIETLDVLFGDDGTWGGIPAQDGEYWNKVRYDLDRYNLTRVKRAVSGLEVGGAYNLTALKADLKEMKKAIKIRLC